VKDILGQVGEPAGIHGFRVAGEVPAGDLQMDNEFIEWLILRIKYCIYLAIRR